MKFNQLIFLLFLVCLAGHAQLPGGKVHRFKPEQLSFAYVVYEPIDDKPSPKCTHTLVNEMSQDWTVICGDKTYSVHLWLTEYRRNQSPKLMMELLYWVSDTSNSQHHHHGTTLWFNFKEPSDFHSLLVKQGVDNDTAGLYLEIK